MDLSGKDLTQMPSLTGIVESTSQSSIVNLRKNLIPRLDNLDSYENVLELDLSSNIICRTPGIGQLKKLKRLDLSSNKIQVIEGFNALQCLVWLNLADNQISRISNVSGLRLLTFLDLSNNKLSGLPHLADLIALNTLYLAGNHILSLEPCRKNIPASLRVLDVSRNQLKDLAQVSYVASLALLEQLCVASNPCLDMTGLREGFNYRPYVLCCCPQLKSIDGFVCTETEILRGEWLYSQGRGRKFLPGQHCELVAYLVTVCPLSESLGPLCTDEEVKMKRILEKRKEYCAGSCNKDESSALNGNDSDKENKMRRVQRVSALSSPRHGTGGQLGTSKPHAGNPYDEYDSQPVFAAARSPFYDSCGTPDQHSTTHFGSSPLKRTAVLANSSRPWSTTPVKRGQKAPPTNRSATAVDWKGLRKQWQPTPSPPQLKAASITSSDSPRSAISQRTTAPTTEWPGVTASTSLEMECSLQSGERHNAAVKIQATWRGYRTRTKDARVQQAFATIRQSRSEQWAKLAVDELLEIKRTLTEEKQMTLFLFELVKQLWQEVQQWKEWRERSDTSSLCNHQDELRTLRDTCKALTAQVGLFLPHPVDLAFQWKTSTSGVLSWTMSPQSSSTTVLPYPAACFVNYYRIYVSGELCGDVKNGKTKALVTDLESCSSSHRLCVKAVFDTGIESVGSEELVVTNTQEFIPGISEGTTVEDCHLPAVEAAQTQRDLSCVVENPTSEDLEMQEPDDAIDLNATESHRCRRASSAPKLESEQDNDESSVLSDPERYAQSVQCVNKQRVPRKSRLRARFTLQ